MMKYKDLENMNYFEDSANKRNFADYTDKDFKKKKKVLSKYFPLIPTNLIILLILNPQANCDLENLRT